MAIDREHRVALVLEVKFGPQLEALAETRHVWAVRSTENESAAHRFWSEERDDGSDPLCSGITLFDPQGATNEEVCLSILDDIDEHHGEFSHDPALNVLEVYGASLTKRIREEFSSLGFRRFDRSEVGFVAFREHE